MGRRSKSYNEHLLKQLRDPAVSAAYLKAAVQDPDHNQSLLMRALRNVVESLGVGYVSDMTGLNRQNLYRMLSGDGNPQLSSLLKLIKALGMRLAFEAEEPFFAESENELTVTTAESHASYDNFQFLTSYYYSAVTQDQHTELKDMEFNDETLAAAA